MQRCGSSASTCAYFDVLMGNFPGVMRGVQVSFERFDLIGMSEDDGDDDGDNSGGNGDDNGHMMASKL